MKWIFLLLLMMPVVSFANTIDSRIVRIDGSQSQLQVELKTEKTHLEWRDEQVPATCYRTVYRRSCNRIPPNCRTICSRGRCRRVCSPARQICRTIPVTVPYRCTRTIRREVTVHDYFVEQLINFQISNLPDSNLSEAIKVTAIGELLQVEQYRRNNYQIQAVKTHEAESYQAGVKYIQVDYRLDLF